GEVPLDVRVPAAQYKEIRAPADIMKTIPDHGGQQVGRLFTDKPADKNKQGLGGVEVKPFAQRAFVRGLALFYTGAVEVRAEVGVGGGVPYMAVDAVQD